ncbi:MAG: ankyrin repeat domain-containing protein [Planctomycetota bacterium]
MRVCLAAALLLGLSSTSSGMDAQRFKQRMGALTKAEPQQGLALAQALRKELLAEPQTDPQQLGWAVYYELRALYALKRWQEAYELADKPQVRPHELVPPAQAFLHAAASECAYHLKDGGGVLKHGQRCLDLQAHKLNDLAGAADITMRMLGWLGELRRLDFLDVTARNGLAIAVKLRTGVATELALRSLDLLLRMQKDEPTKDRARFVIPRLDELAALRGQRTPDLFKVIAFARVSPSLQEHWTPRERGVLEAGQALWQAASLGQLEAVSRALAAGASPDFIRCRSPGIPTPLLAAAHGGHAPVVQALLAAKAHLDLTSTQGRTALSQAADQGHLAVVQLLLQAKAKLDPVDVLGHGALHRAAANGHTEVVRTLLAAGAHKAPKDRQGLTPLQLAIKGKHESAAALLR